MHTGNRLLRPILPKKRKTLYDFRARDRNTRRGGISVSGSQGKLGVPAGATGWSISAGERAAGRRGSSERTENYAGCSFQKSYKVGLKTRFKAEAENRKSLETFNTH